MTQILTAEQVASMSVEDINKAIKCAMEYDEYKWQKEQGIRITEPFRAEGLHKVLYKCPHCMAESEMGSEGTKLFCKACGKVWNMTELGELEAENGDTEFSHIPDWFEWERSDVRRQIEEGSYRFEDKVDVYSLPRCMKFEHLGEATLTHTTNDGFVLKGRYNGEDYEINRTPESMYGVHVEYDYCYIKPFDCIDISTEKDPSIVIPKRMTL